MNTNRWFSKFCFFQIGLLTLIAFQGHFASPALAQTNAPPVEVDEYANEAAGLPPTPIASEPLPDNGQILVSTPPTDILSTDLTYEDLLDYFLGPGSADAYIAGLSNPPLNTPATKGTPTHADQ